MPIEESCVSPEVSIVIVNYNAGKWLLQSVCAALAEVSRVIIVDNASHDESLSLVEAQFLNDERVVIIRSESNQGFAVACNRGACVATTPFIFFLNPDCMLQAQAVARLIEVLKKNPAVGMVGGLLTDEQGVEQRGGRRFIPTLRHGLLNLLGLSRLGGDFNLHKQPLPAEPIEIEAISGAMMCIRQEVFVAVAGFDEQYFLHCEDLDLCMRVSLAGWKIFFVPNAIGIHRQGTCSRARPLFVSWNKHKGMVRFYRKFSQPHHSMWLEWLVVLGIWVRFGIIVIQYLFLHKTLRSVSRS